MALFLQHGARIKLRRTKFYKRSVQHSERFIELLRAADTDFSGVRQRIASVNKDEWAPLNLAILDQKLTAADATGVVRHQRQTSSLQRQ